jgi:hypothetical protein
MAKRTQDERLLPANAKSIKKAVRKCAGADGVREYRVAGVRGLVLNVLPSGTATWYFHYDHQQGRARKRRKLRIGRLDDIELSEAQDRVEELRPSARRGEDPAAAKSAAMIAMTFGGLVDSRFQRGDRLTPGTEYDYRLLLERDVLPAIGSLPAESITRQHVLDIIDGIAARGSSRRADTARVIISSIFAYGIDRGYVSENPATGMRNRHAYFRGTSSPRQMTSVACGRPWMPGRPQWRLASRR